jgi:hypothetical protein
MAPPRFSITPAATRLAFGELLETAEIGCPHLSENSLERAPRLPVGAVIPTGPRAPLHQEAVITQNPKILRHRWPADVGRRRDIARRSFRIPDQSKDLPPPWAADGIHHVFQPGGAAPSSGLHF